MSFKEIIHLILGKSEDLTRIVDEFTTAVDNADTSDPVAAAAALKVPLVDLLTELKDFTKDECDVKIDHIISKINELIPSA